MKYVLHISLQTKTVFSHSESSLDQTHKIITTWISQQQKGGKKRKRKKKQKYYNDSTWTSFTLIPLTSISVQGIGNDSTSWFTSMNWNSLSDSWTSGSDSGSTLVVFILHHKNQLLLRNHRIRPSCAKIGSNIHLISHNSHSPVMHTTWPMGNVTLCGPLNNQLILLPLKDTAFQIQADDFSSNELSVSSVHLLQEEKGNIFIRENYCSQLKHYHSIPLLNLCLAVLQLMLVLSLLDVKMLFNHCLMTKASSFHQVTCSSILS